MKRIILDNDQEILTLLKTARTYQENEEITAELEFKNNDEQVVITKSDNNQLVMSLKCFSYRYVKDINSNNKNSYIAKETIRAIKNPYGNISFINSWGEEQIATPESFIISPILHPRIIYVLSKKEFLHLTQTSK